MQYREQKAKAYVTRKSNNTLKVCYKLKKKAVNSGLVVRINDGVIRLNIVQNL